jgi:hypothetical protein
MPGKIVSPQREGRIADGPEMAKSAALADRPAPRKKFKNM